MNNVDRDTIHTLSGAYAVDALDHEERQAFEHHLAVCEDCRHEVRSLRAAASTLSAPEAVAPPPELRDALLAAVRSTRQLPPLTGRTDAPADAPTRDADGEDGETVVPLRRRFPGGVPHLARRYSVGLAAAAAMIALAVGVGVTAPWQDPAPTAVAAEVLSAGDAESVSQSFPDGSSAVLTRSRSQGAAVLETTDMPDPESDSVFQLWVLDGDGPPVPAGLMTDGGSRTVMVEGDARDATAVAITAEPAGGSPAPTSEPIATFELDEGGA